MILSDREIQYLLYTQAIRISPSPAQGAWSSTSVDLTLHKTIKRWKLPKKEAHLTESILSVHTRGAITSATNDPRCCEDVDLDANPFIFRPQEFLLAWTKEKICLPHRSRIAARVEGKSSLGRFGIGVHVTAPTIHAGFGYSIENPDDFSGSSLQLEIFHVGTFPVELKSGMAICQLIFEEVRETPEAGYAGQFSTQGPR